MPHHGTQGSKKHCSSSISAVATSATTTTTTTTYGELQTIDIISPTLAAGRELV